MNRKDTSVLAVRTLILSLSFTNTTSFQTLEGWVCGMFIWDTKVPRHHALNTYVLLIIMHTQGYIYLRYIYPTHIYPRYVYPRYIYPGYTYPIYTYPDYVYIHIFYIPNVYMPKKPYLGYAYPIHVY
jgi:hypothetical protein